MEHTRFIGLDIHKERISIAVAESGRSGAVEYLGEVANDPGAISKLCDRLGRPGRPLAFCYEAGPCGYGVYRQLKSLGHRCDVVAPSLIPMKPGDRVKTDRRPSAYVLRITLGNTNSVQIALDSDTIIIGWAKAVALLRRRRQLVAATCLRER
jgi:transposase